MMTTKNIAILMPVYNGDKTLARAIKSVGEQTLLCAGKVKVVMFAVDNGSTDSTTPEIENNCIENKIKYKLLDCPQRGIVPALNTGLFSIVGGEETFDYIARLDADDRWHPNKLKAQLDFLEANPDVHVLGTQIRRCDTSGNPLEQQVRYPTSDKEIKDRMVSGDNSICHPSVMFRTEVLLRTGVYDSTYPIAEDYHLWLKALQFFNFANLEEVLVDYTVAHNPKYNPLTPQMCAIAMRQAYQRLHPKEK